MALAAVVGLVGAQDLYPQGLDCNPYADDSWDCDPWAYGHSYNYDSYCPYDDVYSAPPFEPLFSEFDPLPSASSTHVLDWGVDEDVHDLSVLKELEVLKRRELELEHDLLT